MPCVVTSLPTADPERKTMSKYAALESSLGEHTRGELRPEIAAAYRDAKARGLPDGWTCTIDVSLLVVRFLLCVSGLSH